LWMYRPLREQAHSHKGFIVSWTLGLPQILINASGHFSYIVVRRAC
jgi:hypothetical protein